MGGGVEVFSAEAWLGAELAAVVAAAAEAGSSSTCSRLFLDLSRKYRSFLMKRSSWKNYHTGFWRKLGSKEHRRVRQYRCKAPLPASALQEPVP